MMIPSSVTHWLVAGVLLVLVLQALVVLAWTIHNLLADFRLRRMREGSSALAHLFEELQAVDSVPMRRELASARLARDLESLEQWIDLVSARGEDPADIPADDFERSGLVDRYVQQLRDDRRWTRRATAAAILGWTGSPRAVEPLLECTQNIRGESVQVRSVALRALARIHHPDAAPPLLRALDSDETWLPPAVAGILVRIGEPVLQPLSQRLVDPDAPAQGRRWAAQILGDIGDRRALQSLHRALSDMDPEIRARAARAIGEVADERSVTPLLDRLLVDPIPFVRTSVARALGCISTERTVQFLVEALGDPEWWVRLRAVEALEQVGEPARDLLRSALHDRDPQVAHEASRALEGQGVVAAAVERIRTEGYDPANGEFLVDIGRAGNVEPLLDELESDDIETIRVIVRILARVGDPRAGDGLALLLERKIPPGLKARVLDALRRCGCAEFADLGLPLLQDEDEWVRKTAVDYVGAFAGPSAAAAVLPLVGDENPWTRESALRVLEHVGFDLPTDPRILACLEDEKPFVRAQAVRTLCAVRDYESMLRSEIPERMGEAEIRHALLDGMRAASSPDALPIIGALAAFAAVDDLDRLTVIVRGAFRDSSPERIEDEINLRRGQDSAPSARWIAATLLAIAPPERREVLLASSLVDPDPRVRAAAIMSAGHARLEASLLRAVVLRALQDDAPHVVRAGLRAAALDPRDGLREEIERCLRHRDEEVRVDAALALAFHPSPASGRIRGVGLDRSPAARLAATVSRMYRGEEESVTDWLDLLLDDEQRDRLAEWFEGDHPIAHVILNDNDDPYDSLARRLLRCRSPFDAEQLLLEELDTHPDAAVRRRALDGLTRLGTERAAGRILSAFMKDQSPDVRSAALSHLVQNDVFGRRRHFVEVALRDPVESLQIAAAHLCVMLSPEEALPLLTSHLGTHRPLVLQTVSDILAGFFVDDSELVMDIFLGMNPTAEHLVGLVTTLEKTAAPLSTDLLDLLLGHRSARVRARALPALLPRLGDGAWDALRRGITDPAPSVRREAVQCLASPRLAHVLPPDDDRVRQILGEARHDPSSTVRARAALTIGALRPEGARSWLRELRRDENPRVARAADRAWKRLDRKPEAVTT